MRQDQDVQYMLLFTGCLMHSHQMRTDAISESMIQVLYCHAVSCGDMYCIGYSLFDNVVCITACLYMYTLCHTVSHYSLVYTYFVLNYSYKRNGSTTITLYDNNIIGLVSWI